MKCVTFTDEQLDHMRQVLCDEYEDARQRAKYTDDQDELAELATIQSKIDALVMQLDSAV